MVWRAVGELGYCGMGGVPMDVMKNTLDRGGFQL